MAYMPCDYYVRITLLSRFIEVCKNHTLPTQVAVRPLSATLCVAIHKIPNRGTQAATNS